MNCHDMIKNGLVQPIGWNFGKFVLDKTGRVQAYFTPKLSPMDDSVTSLITKLQNE
eukprot:CAMPEP_0116910210 /NCGR_PEP_ID=MMETSP0467-20121206/14737_1 /TAXON_ID=283647 /ORGANISM="Mesodinium pulex, Strain SPMC105" /LENGTH=55 /DNA_ID=CAMNT_0004585719 /DNA_START=489 /DNA_END=656 /DNA_ORIENTATION=-